MKTKTNTNKKEDKAKNSLASEHNSSVMQNIDDKKIDVVIKDKDDSKSSMNPLLIMVLIILGVILAVFLYSIATTDRSVEEIEYYNYNNYSFVKEGPVWKTQITLYKVDSNGTVIEKQLVNFTTNYGPKEIDNISSEGNYLEVIEESDNLIMSFDSDIGRDIALAGIEIKKSLVYLFNWDSEDIEIASLSDTENFPTITCTNASEDLTVITFELSDKNSISTNGECIEVTGKTPEDITKAADKIVFELAGIIE